MKSVTDKPAVKRFLAGVLTRIRHGASFADALADPSVTFPKGYVGMIRAGEAGGGSVLEATLERLAGLLKREQKARDTISSAMIYPFIVLGVAVVSIVSILLFVLPQFEPLFASARDSLRLSTRLVMALSDGLRHYGPLLLLIALGSVFGLRKIMDNEILRLRRDGLFLRLPRIGSIINKAETARFCNTLGTLLSNGVVPVAALGIAVEGFSNSVFVLTSKKIIASIKEGNSLSSSLCQHEIFPALLLQLISVGEETGKLDLMLLRTAEIYDREVQRSIERAMNLITPLTTVILGVIVAAIIAAILSAILSVNDFVT